MKRRYIERAAWGFFAVGGALSGGYLLGLGEGAGWWLISVVLFIGAVSVGSRLFKKDEPARDPALRKAYDQLESRARTVQRLLEACQRDARQQPIPISPLRETVSKTLAEAKVAMKRWDAASNDGAPSREGLEARRKSCQRLEQLVDDEGSQQELSLTVEHQERTLSLIAASERARWTFWLGLERLLATLESIDLALRMALTRDGEIVDGTELEALVEAMGEAAGALRQTADELGV